MKKKIQIYKPKQLVELYCICGRYMFGIEPKKGKTKIYICPCLECQERKGK